MLNNKPLNYIKCSCSHFVKPIHTHSHKHIDLFLLCTVQWWLQSETRRMFWQIPLENWRNFNAECYVEIIVYELKSAWCCLCLSSSLVCTDTRIQAYTHREHTLAWVRSKAIESIRNALCMSLAVFQLKANQCFIRFVLRVCFDFGFSCVLKSPTSDETKTKTEKNTVIGSINITQLIQWALSLISVSLRIS